MNEYANITALMYVMLWKLSLADKLYTSPMVVRSSKGTFMLNSVNGDLQLIRIA